MIARFNDGPRCGFETPICLGAKRFIFPGKCLGLRYNQLTKEYDLAYAQDVYELKSESDGVAYYQFKETLED